MLANRIQAFDIAKVIAIYAVILTHCAGIIGGMQELRYFIETFYLSMFFVISGYFSNSTKQCSLSINEFISFKFKRLIIPFISILTFTVLISLIIHGKKDIEAYIIDDAKGGYWFIYTLFIFNLILCFCRKVIQNFTISSFVYQCIVLVIPWIIIVMLCSCFSQDLVSILSLASCRRYYLFFVIGYFSKTIGLYSYIIQSRICYIGIVLFYIIFSFILVRYVKDINTTLEFGVWFLTNFLGSIFWLTTLIAIETRMKYKFPTLFLKIGQNSLGIYLFHYFLLVFLRNSSIMINKYLYLFITSVIILLLTYYFVIFIRKNKILSKVFLGNS